MKKYFATLIILIALSANIFAQKSKSELADSIDTYLASGQQITAAQLRIQLKSISNSAFNLVDDNLKDSTWIDSFVKGFGYLTGTGAATFDSTLTVKTLKQSVTNGTKTGNITHDVIDNGNSGAYEVNNAGALTVSIHDLESGIGGAVYLNIVTANPSSITVNFYSDGGVTSISKREFGTISSTLGKTTIINFDCVSDGTNTYVIATYGESN